MCPLGMDVYIYLGLALLTISPHNIHYFDNIFIINRAQVKFSHAGLTKHPLSHIIVHYIINILPEKGDH